MRLAGAMPVKSVVKTTFIPVETEYRRSSFQEWSESQINIIWVHFDKVRTNFSQLLCHIIQL